MQTNVRIFATVALFLVSTSVLSSDRIPFLETKKSDPFKLCIALDKKLPLSLVGYRKLGKLEKETVRPDSDYCYESSNQCQIHSLEFTGLRVELLEKKPRQQASVLTLGLTGSRWDILGVIQVGQELAEIESYFGVKIPRDVSPIRLIGECSSIDVKHQAGRITELFLDCQACN
jgi:hypothetical protein